VKSRNFQLTGLLVFLTSCGGGGEMGGPTGGQLRVTAHTTGITIAVDSYTVIVVGVTEQSPWLRHLRVQHPTQIS
jgi:hypothetical protein